MLALTLTLACAVDPARSVSGSGDATLLDDLVIEETWLACTVDAECTYVPLDCASCTSGGTSLAIHVLHVADFEQANPLECDPDMGYIALYTCDGDPVCRAGQCEPSGI